MSVESMYNSSGRKIVFTPERLDQIRNLVERGHNREQIAEIIGCTVGSLQVTCSRLSISLRRPKSENGMRPPAPEKKNGNGNGEDHGSPAAEPVTLTLRIEHRGRVREIPIQLPSEAVGQLILAAELRGLRLNEFIIEILAEVIERKKS